MSTTPPNDTPPVPTPQAATPQAEGTGSRQDTESMQGSGSPQGSGPKPKSRKTLTVTLLGSCAILLLLLILGGLYRYAHSAAFAARLRTAVIAELERSTGGKVDLGAFHLDLLHLGFEADNLTIHGKEGPGQLPYAHIDRLIVHLKIINLLGAKIGLSYLGAERPIFHLIIYPDGSTNAPEPSRPSKSSSQEAIQQIFDLAINQIQLNEGLLVVNQRKIPFNLAAHDLAAKVSYQPTGRNYQAQIKVQDLALERGSAPSVHSTLTIALSAWRNHLQLTQLQLKSKDAQLLMTGSLLDYAHPDLALRASGQLDLRVLDTLAGETGFRNGMLGIEAKGQGTADRFLVEGKLNLKDLIYKTDDMHTDGISAESQFLVTQDTVSVTDFRAWLKRGGSFRGQVLLSNWLHPAQKPTPQQKNKIEQGKIQIEVESLPLNSLLAVFAPPRYQDFGFDTAMTGKAEAHWTGSASNLESSTNLRLAPAGYTENGEVPVSGAIVGSYSLARGTAQLDNLTLITAATHGHAAGNLGINRGMHGSRVTVNLETTDLGEFDKMLAAFELTEPGKRTRQLVPINLKGSASFHGTVSGTANDPDVQGELSASQLQILRTSSADNTSATQSFTIDRLSAQAGYTAEQLSLTHATLNAGSANVTLSGTLTAHRSRRLGPTYDQNSALQVEANLSHAKLEEILPMLGVNLPVSGTAQASVTLTGTIADPLATGSLHLQGGKIYGEPYQELSSDLQMFGRTLSLDHLVYLQDGGRVEGNASYNLTDQQFSLKAQGTGFRLEKIHRIQTEKYPISGMLSFDATGSGTINNPAIDAQLKVTGLEIAHQEHGTLTGTATTAGRLLTIEATSHLNPMANGATLADSISLQATTQLSAPYQTEAKLAIANLDLNPVVAILGMSGVESHRPLNAEATLNGPISDRKQLRGELTLSPISITAQKINLATDQPVHLTLKENRLILDPLVVAGPNIHFTAQGSMNLLGRRHWIKLNTTGTLDMQLAKVFSHNLNSSGKISFGIDAGGTIEHPSLNGLAQISDVNLSLENYINGLSRLNGTLVFNEGRVDLKDVTGYSGGGQIALTGFATYAAGFYADITANAQDVRVRYPAGVTSTINAKLRLQGGLQGMLLSGNAELVRFSISPNIDLSSLVGDGNSISLPPNPNDFSNRIRLDIHLSSAPSLDFQNSFAKLAGTVNLQVRGTVEEPSVLGQITITEGEATFADTTYQLQRGVIYFTNPIRIEPIIDLDATTEVENYNVTVGIHGSPDHLTPIFRSSPPLSEQDIFSLLALGRTQEEQQIYSQEQAQAGVNSTADAILGSAINATVSNRIQKLFGGGSVKIDPTYVSTTGNATARLTVKQQIAKNITLTYATNVNSNAQQLIQGQWNITPNVSIMAVRDESGVFSLVFSLRRQYR